MTARRFMPLATSGVAMSQTESDEYLDSLGRLIEAGQVEGMVNIAVVRGPAPGTFYVRTWADGVTLVEVQEILSIALDSAKEVVP